MKKWIRWKGLMFFFCFAVLLSLIWFVFAPVFVERMIEKYGTDMVGAKVELDDADLTLSPLGFVLKRLQITNPDEPMTNAVEIADIGFSLDGLNLLRRKVVIDEMNLDQVQINTHRGKSGAIRKKPREISDDLKKRKGKTLSLPSLKIPDVNEILEKENLVSLELIRTLDSDIKAEELKWERILNEIPDKEKLDEYKKRIEKIKSAKKEGVSGILEGVSEAAEIKKDIDSDLKQIQDAHREFETSLASLKKRMDEAKKAPLEDIRRLKAKYSISPTGLGNLSRLILGPKIGEWTDRAFFWYEKIKPALKRAEKDKKTGHKAVKPMRGKGINIVYKEKSPLPDFLIRDINASVKLKAGDIGGKIRNITTDQDILGIPLTFIFSGDKLKGVKSAEIKGSLDHIVPTKSKDTLNMRIKGYQLQEMTLSDHQELPLTLKEGLMNLTLNSQLKGEAVKIKTVANFGSVKFTTEGGRADSLFAQTISSTLSDITGFSLMVDITGTLDNYETDISSDLDQIMKKAVGNLVKKESASLERKLRPAVYAKVNGPSDDLKLKFSHLASINNELVSRLDLGKNALDSFGVKNNSKIFKLPF